MIVFARQCIECGSSAEADHHVIPRSRGGTATVPLCGHCHARAHNRDGSMSTGALTAAAFARLKAEGKHWGAAPYGHQIGADGRLEERPDQQEVLRRIVSLRETMTWVKVASTLNAEGVPALRGGKWTKIKLRGLFNRRQHLTVRRSRQPHDPLVRAEIVAQYTRPARP